MVRAKNHEYASGGSAKSWAELLQTYNHSRRNVPWEDGAAEKPHFVTRYSVSRKEREFEPILQKHRSAEEETRRAKKESELLQRTLSSGMERASMHHAQTYDIITHVTRPWKKKDAPKAAKPRKPDSNTWYNIITNKDAHLHVVEPRNVSPIQRPAGKPVPEDMIKINQRDFDVISNKYRQDHEEKTKIDTDVARENAARKFWKTHDFNLVTCKLYDKDKEKTYRRNRNETNRTHGSDYLEKLPPMYAQREGALYNFISLKAKDSERLKAYDVKKESLKDRVYSRMRVEQKQREDARRLAELGATRAMNRTSFRRTLENFGSNRRYNIVDGRSFRRRKDDCRPSTISSPTPKSLWERTTSTSFRDSTRPVTTSFAAAESERSVVSSVSSIAQSKSVPSISAPLPEKDSTIPVPVQAVPKVKAETAETHAAAANSTVIIPKLDLPGAQNTPGRYSLPSASSAASMARKDLK